MQNLCVSRPKYLIFENVQKLKHLYLHSVPDVSIDSKTQSDENFSNIRYNTYKQLDQLHKEKTVQYIGLKPTSISSNHIHRFRATGALTINLKRSREEAYLSQLE